MIARDLFSYPSLEPTNHPWPAGGHGVAP